MLRIPAWATSTTQNTVTVNGAAVADAITPGSYLRVERAWKDGDVIEAHFPMTLWTDPLNDYHAVRLRGGERMRERVRLNDYHAIRLKGGERRRERVRG